MTNPELDWQACIQAEKSGTAMYVPAAKDAVRVGIIPDLHIPHHDTGHLDSALAAMRGFEHIIILGDLIDAYSISSFNKDPGRKTTLQSELEVAKQVLARIRRENPQARIDLLEGNHEDRLRRYLWQKAPELASLKGMSIPELLDCHRHKIAYHSRNGFKMYGWRFKHGDTVKSGAGNTARAEMTNHRCSGVTGHTHRLGKATFVDKEGMRTDWWEAGHLCKQSAAEYVNQPDWQAGYLLGEVGSDGWLDIVPVSL